jgi:hypothetical protein
MTTLKYTKKREGVEAKEGVDGEEMSTQALWASMEAKTKGIEKMTISGERVALEPEDGKEGWTTRGGVGRRTT